LYRIEDFQNNPFWTPSFGEKLDKIHFRSGHLHAECDPQTGFCSIHYDEHDPSESPTSLVKHLAESKTGSGILIVAGLAVLDHIFNDGKLRKKAQKFLSS